MPLPTIPPSAVDQLQRPERSPGVVLAKGGAPPEDEQRHAVRHSFITFAWYKRIDDGAADEEQGVARSCDVSNDGVGMVTTRNLPLNAYLFLELIAGGSRISALGRVKHTAAMANGHFRVGIRIQSVPPTCKLAWERLTKP